MNFDVKLKLNRIKASIDGRIGPDRPSPEERLRASRLSGLERGPKFFLSQKSYRQLNGILIA
jgi:hypothetical protein